MRLFNAQLVGVVKTKIRASINSSTKGGFMNIQDRKLLQSVYGLDYKQCSSVFKMVRTGFYTLDSAAKKVLSNDKVKK